MEKKNTYLEVISMKEKIKNFLDRPVTWRDSVKAGLIGVGVTALIYGGCYIWIKVQKIKAAKELEEKYDYDTDEE